jgi:NodT family efflux transporter outer membrane factor (OMF) lipoprotein
VYEFGGAFFPAFVFPSMISFLWFAKVVNMLNRNICLWPILLYALLLSGCIKVGPDYVRPQTALSPNWLEVKDERVKTEAAEYRSWWEVFNDPVLNRLIDRAYHENLSLKVAGVRVLEARAQLGIAVGNLYPQTQQANGSITYNRISAESFQGAATQAASNATGQGTQTSIPSYWQDQINLNAAWEIDFWGKFRRAVESADASLRMSLADYDTALVSLTADAANSYVQIRTLEKRIEIARQNVTTQKEGLEIAEARFEGGVTSERDVEQAKTLLFNTMATVPILEAQLRQTQNALSVLIGLPPADLTSLLEGSSDIPAPPPQVAIGIPADLLRRRPDVRSAELQAAAQSAQIGIAKADLLPAFSLTGSFGFLSTDLGNAKLSDMFNWKARQGSAGPSFQWNILNYGRITNNVRFQDARFQELLISYQNSVLTAQQQVEDSLAGFLRSQENAEFLAKSADAAKRSLDLAFIQYQQGSTDFTTVLTAQQALLTAQDSFASAMGSISTNLVGIYRALGGGWQIREGQDIVSPDIIEAMSKRTNWGKLLSPAVYMPPSSEQSTIRPPDW